MPKGNLLNQGPSSIRGRGRKENMIRFTIDLPPITKKNHQQIVKAKGRYMVIPSKPYRDYEKAALECGIPALGIQSAVNVKALFYMQTRRRVDLVNLQEALLDVLVKAGCIADDNSKVVFSMDGSRVLYDKHYPHTEVEIERIYDTD